jgi:hypothetical protein
MNSIMEWLIVKSLAGHVSLVMMVFFQKKKRKKKANLVGPKISI